ncbi:RICIN domain-containing protein [Streptosporangium sp. NPDC048047]|uniref:RICIN domain-containing protein n=1 Tax=Streptosporangium sp. NPDC048047 TaxID=3155748 RepID=UPI003447A2E5
MPKSVPKILLALTTALSFTPLAAAPAQAATAVTAPVNPGLVTVDEFQGFGTSLAWWADVVGGWKEPQRSQLMNYLFTDSFSLDGKTVQGINLSSARYNLGASEPGVDYPVVDPHLPPRNGAWIDSLIRADGTYDWNVDANQRWVLAEAAKRGVGSFELFSNSPPWWMTYSGHPAGRYSHNSPEGCSHSNLRPEYQDDFAAYLATVAQRFATVGVNGAASPKVRFKTVEPFNEPSNGWWCWGNNQEGTFLPASEQSSVILALRSALDSRGMDTGVSATDSNNYWLVASEYDALSPAARAALAQINAHGYAGSDPEPVRDRVQAGGMRFWQSEWGPAGWGGYDITSEMDAALELATRVTNDLSYVGANAWQYWQAIEDSSRGDDPGFWGLIQAPLDGSAQTYDIQKQFHVLGQYSKFIRPGDLVIDSGNGKTVAAYDPAGHKLVLVTYNDTAEALPIAFDLSRFTTAGATAQVWRTSGSENLAQLPSVAVGGTLNATVPANAVTTYVISNVTANSAGTTAEAVNDSAGGFAYAGNWSDNGYSGGAVGAYGLWDQDEHSSQSAGATAAYPFHGTRISLFGTLAPTSGKMAVSIDGGPETTLNLYRTVRVDGANLWTSPALTAGRHTLRVRVLGEAGAAGGGTWGNVDRVVVENSAWTSCAAEGGQCSFTGTAEVRYGANGVYRRGVFAGGVACGNAVFGDPIPGAKRCHYRPVTTAALIPKHSRKCAGVGDSSQTAGAAVIQWSCTGAADQKWTLEKTGDAYRLRPAHAPALCLDVAGASTASGAQAIQWTCGTGPNQQWKFVPAMDGFYRLTPLHAPGMCLDVASAAGNDGAAIAQYSCNGYPNQLWSLGTP